MGKWETRSCRKCGDDFHVHVDWSNTPDTCKSCGQAQWYEVSCQDCGASVQVHVDWDHAPKRCKACKEKNADAWYEVSCDGCGASIRARHDWDHPPKFCKTCKPSFPPIDRKCEHCGSYFKVSTGLQIKCHNQSWERPRKCPTCRQLFKGPLRTVEEKGFLGEPVYRTYNSAGRVISTSYDEKDTLGGTRRRHVSSANRTIGVTRKHEGVAGPYRETTRADGSRKSVSRDVDGATGRRSESTGGSSGTKHTTWSVRGLLGWFRRTE